MAKYIQPAFNLALSSPSVFDEFIAPPSPSWGGKFLEFPCIYSFYFLVVKDESDKGRERVTSTVFEVRF